MTEVILSSILEYGFSQMMEVIFVPNVVTQHCGKILVHLFRNIVLTSVHTAVH